MLFKFIFIFISFYSLAYSENKNLTLKDAQEIAISNNYRMKSLNLQLQSHYEDLKISESSFYPKLGFYYESQDLTNTNVNSGASYLYFKQNILNKNQDHRDLNLKKILIEKQKNRTKQIKFQIKSDVEHHFHYNVYYQDLIKIQSKAILINREHTKTAKKLMAKGRFSKADVMSFEAQGAIFQSDLEILKQKLNESQIQMRKLLGNKLAEHVRPIGELTHQHIEKDLMFYVEKGSEKNSLIASTTQDLYQKFEYLDRYQNNLWPDINFELRTGYLEDSPKELKTTALISVNFEFFSGLSTFNQQKMDLYKYKSEQFNLKQDILDLVSEIEILYRRLKTIELRIDLESKNIDKSYAYFQYIEKEYKRGYKNSSDVSSALENYIQSQKKSKDLKIEFLSERLKLESIIQDKVEISHGKH